ncbi:MULTISPECIES: hypothetical protein [unclassified Campylobacter]|uniref:hypothetical protein n=1 Tax=unclassified Campylobacter TaxID=2593542 RepID=UPI0022E9AEF6|nr:MULTISPECIES: hypothetical protein [unclassified Campylobacter]MDA3073591.1 hypothetical protein [Campylobacter sp. JMF_10 EL2]
MIGEFLIMITALLAVMWLDYLTDKKAPEKPMNDYKRFTNNGYEKRQKMLNKQREMRKRK